MGRRELHRPEVVADDQVDVEPPSEALIEALRSIDIGHGQRRTTSRAMSIVLSSVVSVEVALPTSSLPLFMLTSLDRDAP